MAKSVHTKRRICVVTTNRADYMKLRSVLRVLQKDPAVDLVTIVAGSHLLRNYDNTIEFIRKDGFSVDYTAYIEIDGRVPVTMAKSTGLSVNEFATAFHNLKPDIVLIHGDRYEALAAAIAASLMNIFTAHIEGGEVSGTIDEHIRHAITKLSHLHFVTTKDARGIVIQLGEHPRMVRRVGCPGIDTLLATQRLPLHAIEKRVNERYIKWGSKLSLRKGFILCVQHPVTTEFSAAAAQTSHTLYALKKMKLPVVMLWPNIDAGADYISQTIRLFQGKPEHDFIHVFRNFPPELFLNLLRHASVLVGNSSAGIREASYFGTPVVDIGTRQKGRKRGRNVVSVAHDRTAIARAIQQQLTHGKYPAEYLYGRGGAGRKIADILKTVRISSIQKQMVHL
ncbi:MAG: UDP-N-acetylglucosamine 2-epimerase [Patescibacteria group bacterium]